MIRLLVFGIVLLAVAPAQVAGGRLPAGSTTPVVEAQPADDLIAPPRPQEYLAGVYNGTVTAVDKESITIVSPGWSEKVVSVDREGNVTGEVINVIPPQPPRKFRAGPVMSWWWWRTRRCTPPPSLSYQLADVKVGDKIGIEYRTINGVDYCDAICIQRRPGGRVPPAPGESPDEPRPWHEQCNAEQDFEEKGIPIPERLQPPPIPIVPPGTDWLAPMPREVVPPIPPAKP